jgi:hypothetical protein
MSIILLSITVISVTVAAMMAAIAWRVIRDERRRSDARVAALAADIEGRASEDSQTDLPLAERPAPASVGELFASPQAAPRSRLGATLATGAVIVGSAAALVIVFSGIGAIDSAANREEQVRPKVEPAPLELVSLVHAREPDHLVVRGVVRNPVQAPTLHQVAAVVLLFDRDGGVVASARSAVDVVELAPGAEASFAVTVPAEDVARYRVSFRIDDRILPHVDARKL